MTRNAIARMEIWPEITKLELTYFARSLGLEQIIVASAVERRRIGRGRQKRFKRRKCTMVLGTGNLMLAGAHLLLISTEGVTTAYSEQAHT